MAAGTPYARRWIWTALAVAAALAFFVLVDITIAGPRVHVRWHEDVTPEERATLERRYDLRRGTAIEDGGTTWRYDLGATSRANIRALIRDPAVDDTAYLDREAFEPVEGRTVAVTIWVPFRDLFSRPSEWLPLHRSLWLLLGGGALFWAARAASVVRRRNVAIAALLLAGVLAVAFPHDPSLVKMGGSADHVRSRVDFESWFGGRVRYEKHLSQVLLLQIYLRSGPSAAAPERAQVAMTRFATLWLLAGAVTVGLVERWSPLVLRYLGLVLLAPSALLYFGWRELGYLSLSVAAFPLLARGLRNGSMRLEAGSAFAGLGAALHGSGLVSLAGVGLAAAGASGTVRDRVGRLLRVTAWGTAAYLGWIAIYVIGLKLSIQPDPGPAAVSGWRPLFVDEVRLGRFSAAIVSPTGARDLLMSGWIVGVPLLAIAATLWRRHEPEVRAALWYLPPSLLFLILRWPFDGIGGGMDLVAAGFPAFYALAWVCAHDRKRANIAALLLISAHYAFWRVVLDERFAP